MTVSPSVHLADMGFIDAELLVESQQRYQVDLYGPVRGDYHRQAREGQGFASQDLRIDWVAHRATCPAERQSSKWTPAIDTRKNPVIQIKFSPRDCGRCEHHPQCTDGARRTITIRPQEQYEALATARARQTSADFKQRYRQRAGVEGIMSQAVRRCDVRHARYVGVAKTRLQHLAVAAAINLVRISDWLDERPRATTRHSAFERLYRLAAA